MAARSSQLSPILAEHDDGAEEEEDLSALDAAVGAEEEQLSDAAGTVLEDGCSRRVLQRELP